MPSRPISFPGATLTFTEAQATLVLEPEVCQDCDEAGHVAGCSFIRALAALPPGMDLIGHLIYHDEFWREVLTFRHPG